MKKKMQSNKQNTTPVILRLAGVVRESIVDGPGLRFAIFCQGCPHNCPKCHNQDTHDFSGGYDCDIQKIVNAIEENPLLSGVTFSGGEPSHQPVAFLEIAKKVKSRGLNIWMYSGYTLEELLSRANSTISDLDNMNENSSQTSEKNEEQVALKGLLSLIDVLVDGKFINELKDLTLPFRGSKNQRLIDMAATKRHNKIVLYEG
ncbi:4Fe-4S single cluster domain protein [Eubacterium nodatum ATCC 33099]|nr:4Fe-4S single cluster domain protein [Eubacterium nodatum ATCC 33099]